MACPVLNQEFHPDSGFRTRSRGWKPGHKRTPLSTGCKNPEYWFRTQANTDAHPRNPKPEGLVLTEWMSARLRQTNEAWLQALCKCISKGPGTKRGHEAGSDKSKTSREIMVPEWGAPMSLSFSLQGLGWSILFCTGLGHQNEMKGRAGCHSKATTHPCRGTQVSRLEDMGWRGHLQALGKGLKTKGISQIQDGYLG